MPWEYQKHTRLQSKPVISINYSSIIHYGVNAPSGKERMAGMSKCKLHHSQLLDCELRVSKSYSQKSLRMPRALMRAREDAEDWIEATGGVFGRGEIGLRGARRIRMMPARAKRPSTTNKRTGLFRGFPGAL